MANPLYGQNKADDRLDLIQTEAGMEWQMPESHAYWS